MTSKRRYIGSPGSATSSIPCDEVQLRRNQLRLLCLPHTSYEALAALGYFGLEEGADAKRPPSPAQSFLRQQNPDGCFERVYAAYQFAHSSRERPVEGLELVRIRRRAINAPLWQKALCFLPNALNMIWQLSRLVREERITFIRTYTPLIQGMVGVAVQWLTGVPCVVALHTDPDAESRIYRRSVLHRALFQICQRISLRFAAGVFCVSTTLADYAVRKGARRERVWVIFNKVNIARFQRVSPECVGAARTQLGLDEGSKVVLFVGRLEPEKNLFTLLEAFTEVARAVPESRLILVGDGELRQPLTAFAQRLNLTGQVTFTGALPHDQIPAVMKSATVFALPSFYEGFPKVLIEAQAAGVPLVVSDDPHLRDTVDETCALTFPPDDAAQLAACLIRALSDEGLRQQLREAGERRVQQFDWDAMAQRDVACYQEVLRSWQRQK